MDSLPAFTVCLDDIFLDDVRCSGREKSIADCRHRRWYSSDCSQHEAAGVICAGKLDHSQSNDTTPGDEGMTAVFALYSTSHACTGGTAGACNFKLHR